MSQDTDMPTLGSFEAIELVLISNDGMINGRTVLQKIIYFVTLKVPNSRIEYEPQYFGPYSADVAATLAELRSMGYVYEIPMRDGSHTRYEYGITPHGQEDAKIPQELHSKQTLEIIKKIIADCKESGSLDPDVLSHAAKVHYATTNYGRRHIPKPKTDEEIRNAAHKFGWGISVDDVVTGKALLRKLDLAT